MFWIQMALYPKFLVSWIVLSVVLISSESGAEQPKEGHRCYWCGPLAEQVHRSQRAPKCNGDKIKVTVCDEDLPYCAIVAKSPPYVESRYCVKFYQDECYSLYCNTSKTWKITCPCRGELCNGIKTIRENEAFEALHKQNIGKMPTNTRFRRALVSNVGFIGLSVRRNENKDDQNNKTIHDNFEPEELRSYEMNTITNINTTDESKGDVTEIISELQPTFEAQANARVTEENSDNRNINIERSSDRTNSETTLTEDYITVTPETTLTVNNTVNLTNVKTSYASFTESTYKNNGIIHTDIPTVRINSDDLKTVIVLISSEIPGLVNATKAIDTYVKLSENITKVQSTTPNAIITELHTKVTPETVIIPSTMTDVKTNVTSTKSKLKLPTAEALQHNEVPTTKTIQQMLTTKINTFTEVTTQAMKTRNNSAVRVEAHIFTMIIGIILYYKSRF